MPLPSALRRLVRLGRSLQRERGFTREVLDLARLPVGGHVLEIGCGRGALALEMARWVGPKGVVRGVDPSMERLAEGHERIVRAPEPRPQLDIARAEALPFEDGSFDRVLAVRAVHHMPLEVRGPAMREAYRVLAPGGEVLLVDFPPRADGAPPSRLDRIEDRLSAWLDPTHGDPEPLEPLLEAAGFEGVEQGTLQKGRLRWARGRRP
ncbi:MAG: class I SAM-dependent methyltransferase [Deltaproteobacteria bacterium]|nr:class I SAM-dependent methyltransferase [Deltaproteobacteria bacterium]